MIAGDLVLPANQVVTASPAFEHVNKSSGRRACPGRSVDARDERVHDAYFISLHFAGDDVSVMQLFPDASEISS